MKKILLSIGLSTFLSFNGINYSKAQEVSRFIESSSDYEHVRIKLSDNIDIYMITSRNGCHVNILANYLGITPIISNRKYSKRSVAFDSNNSKLKQIVTELDKDKDGTIDLEELSAIYSKIQPTSP